MDNTLAILNERELRRYETDDNKATTKQLYVFKENEKQQEPIVCT